MTATRYTITATAMKTRKTNGILLRNRQIHGHTIFHKTCLWPSWLWPSWSLFVAIMVCGRHCWTPYSFGRNYHWLTTTWRLSASLMSSCCPAWTLMQQRSDMLSYLLVNWVVSDVGTCEASRFNLNLNRPSDLIRFESDWPIRKFFRIESAVPAPLFVVSLVKRLKPLTALSGTVYRLASSMSDHTPVV